MDFFHKAQHKTVIKDKIFADILISVINLLFSFVLQIFLQKRILVICNFLAYIFTLISCHKVCDIFTKARENM